jgi:hypothetical protein
MYAAQVVSGKPPGEGLGLIQPFWTERYTFDLPLEAVLRVPGALTVADEEYEGLIFAGASEWS